MPSNFLEKTLEDIIYENRKEIHYKGLPKFKKVAFRQVYLPSGRIIDILSYDLSNGYINFDIYELKKDYINNDAVCQAIRYWDEIEQLIKGSFKGYSVKIIMIGKNSDQMPFLDHLNIPVSVYEYDYQLNGISFNEVNCRGNYYVGNEKFSLGLWAWGLDMLTLVNGDPSTMNFHSSIERHLDGSNFEIILRKTKEEYLQEPKLLPLPENIELPEKCGIVTEIFPLQPSWTPEYAKELPPYKSLKLEMFLEGQIDDCDLEDDELELDVSDYEPTGDDEPDYEDVDELLL